jgi:hypothetical protein
VKPFFGRLRAVGLVSAAAAVAVVAAVPGTASAATTWRLAATFAKTGSLQGASASGTTNEWVASPSGASLFLEHRTTKGWQRVPSPALGLAPSETVSRAQVVATPGGGAWVFADVNFGQASARISAARWTGTGWSATQAFAELEVTTVLALSAKDVWQFGPAPTTFVTRPSPGVWHYNGTSWSKFSVPWYVDAASGSGSAGVWIIGRASPSNAKVSVAHWSQGGWQPVPLPAYVPAGSFADGIVADGARDVWASMEYRPNFGPVTFGYLLHWNGSAWSRVSLPFTTVRPRQLASDGRGGLWLSPDPRFLYHYSGGHWSALLKVPGKAGFTSNISQLVAVPGTTSMLAAGALFPKTGTADGAVFAYGS